MMGKRIGVFAILCMLTFGAVACGNKQENETAEILTEEVDKTINFENQTGESVGILCIRPNEDYDWSDNLVIDNAWQNNYKMPIYLNGEVPIMEAGWQVRTVFLDETEKIWEGVPLADNTTVIFHNKDGETSIEVVETENE